MLQPPNTLTTVLKPGLTPEESYSQFKLWAIMKSPLVLGTHWSQLADLATLEPKYFALLTNKEILAINQDMSPQATLVRQFPSKAQQSGAGAMLEESLADGSASAADLRRSVTSPNGTTQAALDVLMGDGGLPNLIHKAVAAAERRSRELGSANNDKG